MTLSKRFNFRFYLFSYLFVFCFIISAKAFPEKTKTVLTGFYENKPKIFTQKSKPAGIFIDILDEIAQKKGLRIKYVKCSWPECMEMLESGEIDLMPDVAFSMERNEIFKFNKEIVFESFSQIYTGKDLKIEKFSELDGKTIALLQGSIQEKILVTMMSGFNYRLKVLHVNSYEEAFELASRGIVDAAVSNHFFGEYFYKSYNLLKTPLVFNPASLHFASPKDSDTELLEKIDRSLKIMKTNPGSTYYKALEKWMDRPPITALPNYFYPVIIISCSFLMLAVVVIFFLKIKIREKLVNLEIFKSQMNKSEKRFRDLFETMGSAVIFQNSNQEIILANRQAESLLNFSLKSGKDRKKNIYADAVTEDGSPLTKENNPFFKASKTGQKTNGQILGIKNEKLKWILINSTPEFEPVSGQPAGVLSVMEDITELKAMEEELMKKNTELEQIFDTVPDAMVYANKTRRILKVNKSFTSLFQYMPDEVIGLSTSLLYNDQAEFNNQGKIRYNPHAPRLTAPYEVEYKRKNSQVFTGETVGSKLTDSKGRVIGMLALIRDVTEKRKIEAIINRSQKIESVGRIAGSIAHDFNNILTVISGYSELIITKTSELPEISSQARQISDAVAKAKKLTRHLLTFSRKQTLTFSKIDINELIRNFRDFLYPVLGRNISLYLSFSEQSCYVKADAGQIEQILMNLAVNSRDSFSSKGKITISSQKIKINGSKTDLVNLPPGDYALITFEDNGCGIEKEVMEHIFEPFFTTKAKDKGTGLGLSTTYGIIKLHGGEITVSSVPGKGTVFRIYLPCSDIG